MFNKTYIYIYIYITPLWFCSKALATSAYLVSSQLNKAMLHSLQTKWLSSAKCPFNDVPSHCETRKHKILVIFGTSPRWYLSSHWLNSVMIYTVLTSCLQPVLIDLLQLNHHWQERSVPSKVKDPGHPNLYHPQKQLRTKTRKINKTKKNPKQPNNQTKNH